MSILIKGMGMPKGCYREHESCPCYKSLKGWAWCGITEKQIINGFNQRPPDCPLIEVPPHGRLVDIDEVDREYNKGYVHKIYDFSCFPTIIEAEGEDDSN